MALLGFPLVHHVNAAYTLSQIKCCVISMRSVGIAAVNECSDRGAFPEQSVADHCLTLSPVGRNGSAGENLYYCNALFVSYQFMLFKLLNLVVTVWHDWPPVVDPVLEAQFEFGEYFLRRSNRGVKSVVPLP